ncbi:Fatty-acyl CoA reductase 1, partial [Operophtera brumata]
LTPKKCTENKSGGESEDGICRCLERHVSGKLNALVHVSTSYSNTNRNPIEEVMYPPHSDWRDTLRICELPNTYTFTKQLAEHMVYEHRGQLPVVIFRPSIVISSVDEPMKGWIDNFNGPIALLVASGKGCKLLLKVLFLHLLPAIFVDIVLWILGRQPQLIKIQRRTYIANQAIVYYATKQWTFHNKNLVSLRSRIKEQDKDLFYYDIENINWRVFFLNACLGAKRYLLKEMEEDMPKAKAHFK